MATRKPHRPASRPGRTKPPGNKGKNAKPQRSDSAGRGERLQKVLAAAGIGSRRECEELIQTGRVEVDGTTVSQLGSRVDPLQQEIRVDGVALPRPRRMYYALNKPAGVVCTNLDPSGRVRAIDLVRSSERLFTVGRLDRTSEGLILLTNDGELANQLTHPRYGVEKRYLVRVVGSPNPALFAKLRSGVHLAEGVARVSDIRVRKRYSKFTDLEVSLREGRNREIRRVLARVGHKVVRLKRIAIGPLKLAELPGGASRSLTRDEVDRLKQAIGKRPEQRGAASKTSPKKSSRGPSVDKRGQRPQPPPPPPPAPAPELDVDELEVTDWEMDRPTGAVLGFDEPDERPSQPRRKRK